ncbi:hypothetical protein ABL78_7776 [Leptomonas seymouri]|uniref:Uncharacterized protein n=1 Tax=Leptomonas seymouri TaxID=5684 RepID=A0A0N0P2P5_LEPSE|nr:hypothetical protein ABL78_7776 [Leptomonas seymouri]|eukprot:KPI83196.1 hypothetical protein ABL78_7776 [Leptomonas seymouri]
MSKSFCLQKQQKKGCSTTTTPSNGLMDPGTAAYLQHYDLEYILRSMGKALCDAKEPTAPVTSAQPPTNQKLHPPPLASWEGSAAETSPLSEAMENSYAAASSTACMSGPLGEETLETTFMLQLLLSHFTPLPITSAASKSNGAKQYSSPPSPLPLPLPETFKDVSDSDSADPFGSPTSVFASGPWPADVSFTTKDAAAKAEVCRCFAQQCERLHSGLSLIDSCGSSLRWANLCPALGGHERLGVALVFDVFRYWRQVVVPLLRTTGDLAVPSDAPARDGAEDLFETMLALPPQLPDSVPAAAVHGSRNDAAAVCLYWCYTVLQGYCRAFPVGLWTSIVCAAQRAAAAQQRSLGHSSGKGKGVLEPPPLTCETLLLRSFMAHLACPAMESLTVLSSSPSVTTTVREVANAYAPEAIAAAKRRSPAWAWAEVEELQEVLSEGGASADDSFLSALLCADGYWAAFLQPYTAMYAQYCL